MKQEVGDLLKEESLPLKGSVRNLSSRLNNVELKMPEVSGKQIPKNEFSSKFKRYAKKRRGFKDDDWVYPDSDFDENDSPKLRRKSDKKLKKLVKISPSEEYSISERKIRESEQLKLNLKRKINGYLIFKHTVMPDLKSLGTASYVNHVLGEKWHELSKDERESYNDMAKKQRMVFKKEIEAVKEQDDFSDSMEQLLSKMKKIKKEQE